MAKRNCLSELQNLVTAKTRCIWVNTYEEAEAINDIVSIVNNRLTTDCFAYSIGLGIVKYKFDVAKETYLPSDFMEVPVAKLFSMIYANMTNINQHEEEEDDDVYGDESPAFKITNLSSCFIFKDAQDLMGNSQVKRLFRDVLECNAKYYNPIFIVSPVVNIPVELEKDITVVDYDTPSKETISQLLEASIKSGKRKSDFIDVSERDKTSIINAAYGLTFDEIVSAFKLSIVKYNTITPDIITDYKIQLIKKSNVLTYEVPKTKLSDIGGNQNFKNWVQEILASMTPEARKFGCAKPKGYLALGVPGQLNL